MMIERVAVFGVGLIGGSFAAALKAARAVGEVVGAGRRRETLERALELGLIDRIAESTADAVRDCDLVLLAAPSHAIAATAGPVDLAAISEHPFIANETRIGYGRLVMAMFAAQVLSPNIVADCDNLESLKLMVASGAGVAVIPRIAAEREIAAGELVALPLRPRRRVALLLIRRHETMPPRVEQCVEHLTQTLTDNGTLTPA